MRAERILICLHDFFRGGTERVALGLARDWLEAGRAVTLLCGTTAGGLRADPRIAAVTLAPPVPRAPFSRLRLAKAMAGQIPALKPQVIFLPGNFHAPLAGIFRKAGVGAPVALKISNPPLPQGLPFGPALFRRFTRGVDGFAAMNRGLAQQVRVLVPGAEVVTLHDPVYLEPVAPSLRADRSAGRTARILWIGRLEPQKDPLLALQVMAAMKVPAQLTLVGEGRMRGRLEREISARGWGARVRLIGHVEETGPYLAEADALLITSRYEGGPAVAIEALAQAVPVVSTDCSFLLRDLLAEPQAGRIVPIRDPARLAQALGSVCAMERTPERLRRLTAAFAPKACAAAYLDWFDSLVRQGHG